jgi:DNA-binding XRE family transcriptional regulator
MAKITLRAARVNAGITQKAASDAVGVSNKTMVKWEKGTAFPNVRQALVLCRLYGLTFDDIIFLPSEPL